MRAAQTYSEIESDGVKERKAFSGRLQQALENAGYSPDSPTQLAREFNIRFSGRPITVHAARKWLVGEAIPTQAKLRTLALWLLVTPEWLRYGHGENRLNPPDALLSGQERLPLEYAKLVENFSRLDPRHRRVAERIIQILLLESRTAASGGNRRTSTGP